VPPLLRQRVKVRLIACLYAILETARPSSRHVRSSFPKADKAIRVKVAWLDLGPELALKIHLWSVWEAATIRYGRSPACLHFCLVGGGATEQKP